jgi:uncharacterized protein (DUF305 family)
MKLKFMQVIRPQAVGFWTVTVTAIIASTGILTACSTGALSQAQTSKEPMTSGSSEMGGMDHGGMKMNHNMDLGPADADYDLRFIDAMIPHHQGGVVMAKDALQKSKRPEIKKLATDIINAQDQEIAEMKQWRKKWYPKASDEAMAWHAQMGHMMSMSAEQKQSMMMLMDLGAADAKFDLRFTNAMIPHHEGAVVMANDALSKSKRPEIQKLAQAIISSQQAEITQMKQWQQSWYKQ